MIISACSTKQVGLTAIAALLFSACTIPQPNNNLPSQPEGESTNSSTSTTIKIDGSSTVYPLTDEVVREFQFERVDTPEFLVAFSGTTGGFRKFCAGETDISDASRPINVEEMEACKGGGVEYVEIPVAYDALTLAVHPDNDWVDSLTVAELKSIWEPTAEGRITNWNQVRPEFPDAPLNLYGAGGDSGTFDYFTEAIVGETRSSRADYTASEDDTELVQGIRKDPNGLAYFGYAYYEESQNVLKPVAIDNGEGAVLPSSETVSSGEYQPLSRPLFIYVNAEALQSNPSLQEFVEFYIVTAENTAKVVGYVPLPDEVYTLALDHLSSVKVGTAFAGEAPTDLKLEDLLQREKTF